MSKRAPVCATKTTDKCHIEGLPYGDALFFNIMPEQVYRFQCWADELGIPLDQFVREATENMCVQLAELRQLAETEELESGETLLVYH
ncbi:MAG: hypothetical protein GY789_00015 [Hyphomicrobiales bacterium]|nr:hypothetical protein [Hyphomicrobiales bacterium]MCP4998835.1 hypothetical protein [Hyphomicrobiales bacterium]